MENQVYTQTEQGVILQYDFIFIIVFWLIVFWLRGRLSVTYCVMLWNCEDEYFPRLICVSYVCQVERFWLQSDVVLITMAAVAFSDVIRCVLHVCVCLSLHSGQRPHAVLNTSSHFLQPGCSKIVPRKPMAGSWAKSLLMLRDCQLTCNREAAKVQYSCACCNGFCTR